MSQSALKVCRRCDESLPLGNFGSDKQRSDGKAIYCRPCNKARSRDSYERNRDRVLARVREQGPRNQYRRLYGITEAEYDQMLANQGGVCATCGALPFSGRAHGRKLAVDHDHSCCPTKSCGKCVRSLLCASCNLALGFVEDSFDTLMNLAAYALQGRDTLAPNELSLAGNLAARKD